MDEVIGSVEREVQRVSTLEQVLNSENDADLVRALSVVRQKLGRAAGAETKAARETMAALEQALAARQALFQRRDQMVAQLCALVDQADGLGRRALGMQTESSPRAIEAAHRAAEPAARSIKRAAAE